MKKSTQREEGGSKSLVTLIIIPQVRNSVNTQIVHSAGIGRDKVTPLFCWRDFSV